MAQMIKVPGVGPVKSTWVIAGGALVAGIVGYAYMTRMNSGEEEEPTSADFTGADYAAEDYAGFYGDAYATDYAYDQGYPQYVSPYPSGVPVTVTSPRPTTNTEWQQAALEHLDEAGVDRATASLALSRYRLKECVTPAQAELVRMAVGGADEPPQGGPYRIITCPGTPTPPGGGGGGGGGGGLLPGSKLGAPGGLRVTKKTRTSVALDWNPVKGAKGYAVFRVADKGCTGKPVGHRITTSTWSNFTVSGLRPGTNYRFDVHAVGSDNKNGRRARKCAKTTK